MSIFLLRRGCNDGNVESVSLYLKEYLAWQSLAEPKVDWNVIVTRLPVSVGNVLC